MVSDLDAIVIGAGVVGLATARALALRGLATAIAEKAPSFGSETSSRNSEVIHAGIYYPHGSLKAQLCVEGRQLLYAYCDERAVAHRKCGKLIVAADESELARLENVRTNAAKLGTELHPVAPAKIAELEPEITAAGALWSRETGIVDSHGLMLQLLADFENAGGLAAFENPVERIKRSGDLWLVHSPQGTVSTRWVINCAGLHASDLARKVDGLEPERIPQTRYARGLYVRAAPSLRAQHLIYPLPQPGGLGVHATIDLQGAVRFGPDVEWIESIDYTMNDSRIEAFRASIARYWPAVAKAELTPDYTGIRPKIAGKGAPDADFAVLGPRELGLPGHIHLFGIESPGLTSCLALAEYVAGKLSAEER